MFFCLAYCPCNSYVRVFALFYGMPIDAYLSPSMLISAHIDLLYYKK